VILRAVDRMRTAHLDAIPPSVSSAWQMERITEDDARITFPSSG